jgi:flagellar hook protein FlgE
MSLFGSMTIALSGMNAQSRALGHISDNVANSQTIGFKRLDTRFENLVTASGRAHETGGVIASAEATNTVQGGFDQVDNPLALALDGRGFFSVARPSGRGVDGALQFDRRELFSRAGDFELNRDGYLVNSVGDVLQGWTRDASGQLDTTQLRPIRAEQTVFQPVPTATVAMSANLPAGAPDGFTATTAAQVYDGLGTLRSLNLGWSRATPADPWVLAVSLPDGTAVGQVEVNFADDGTIAGFSSPAGVAPSVPDGSGRGPATLGFDVDFGGGPQPITLQLGSFRAAEGVTQYASTSYELRNLSQDGAPPGSFASVAIRDDGRVVVNYDNGQNRTVAQVPVVTFADPDALERLDGQAFAVTSEAGAMRIAEAGRFGAGRLEAGAVERSNVDIAAEFAKLIVAQRAYAASTRIVTTSDELLQETINLKR